MDDDDEVGGRTPEHRSLRLRRGAVVVVVAGVAWAVTAPPAFTAASTLAVLGGGIVAIAAGAAEARRRVYRNRPAPQVVTVAGVGLWCALVLAAVAWELAAYVQHPRHEHPTLSHLAERPLDSHPVRAAAYGGWLVGAFVIGRR